MQPQNIEKERRLMITLYAPAGFLMGIASYYVFAIEPWGFDNQGVIAGTVLAILLFVAGFSWGFYRMRNPFDKKTMKQNYKAYSYLPAIVGVVLIGLVIDRLGFNLRDSILSSPFWVALFSLVFALAAIIAAWAAYARVGMFQRIK